MYILDERDSWAADQETWSRTSHKRAKLGLHQRWWNSLYPNQACQHDLLCAVNIRSCKSSWTIFNSLWRDDAFYLSVTGWWVFTWEKTPSAYFRRTSHCWWCPACSMHAWAFVWCLHSIRGSQFAEWHQPNGHLHVEDMTCLFGSLEFACNCLKLCTVWFGVTVNLTFLSLFASLDMIL